MLVVFMQAYMLERLRQAKVFPVDAPATDLVPDTMAAGPMPVLAALDNKDMQAVKELVAECEPLGLLCKPSNNDCLSTANMLESTEPAQTASKVEMMPDNKRLTATEQKQILMRKAGKHTKSRYQLLLHVALNRRKGTA